MKIVNKLLFGVSLMICCWGCGDFFEENSQNQAYVASIADLDELLRGEAYIEQEGFYYNEPQWERLMVQTNRYFPWIHLLDDDITEFAEGYHRNRDRWCRVNASAAYRWQPNPFWDKDKLVYNPDDWKQMYKRIAALNSILYEFNNLEYTGSNDTLWHRVEGEASFLRAYYYYWLVNIYAQPYALSSADTELGVPLKISEVVEDKYFSRASVQEVYDQIRKDLQRSIRAFSNVEKPVSPIKANYTAACILMSRVCLYMEDYDGAIAYADSAILRNDYSILDLNSLTPGESFTYMESPETVFSQGGYIMGQIHTGDSIGASYRYSVASAFKSSDELLQCYHENDLRKDIFFLSSTYQKSAKRCIKFREKGARISDYMLFRFPEVYLNKAEALAIKGNEAEAKDVLNTLRGKRFLHGHMPSIEEEMAISGENLVNFIRTERRREFCFEGQRWFDLRRYAVNSKYPYTKTIRHEVREWQGGEEGFYTTIGYYELKPYMEDRAAYVFPLPSEEIIFNKGELVQNEMRPDREIILY